MASASSRSTVNPFAGRDTKTRDKLTAAVTRNVASPEVAANVKPRPGHPAPIDEELWERRMKALTMRNMGATFSFIAADLGISPTVARADVRLALKEVLSESTEDFIARQRSVLLDCQRGAYPLALQGDKDAIMAIVRCLEQEAKLLGLYAPQRMAMVPSNVEFAEQAAELIEKLGLEPPKELMAHVRGNADQRAAAIMESMGDAGQQAPLDASEIDGLVERVAALGFDIPAVTFAIDSEPVATDEAGAQRASSEDALADAAAAAIDPTLAEQGGWSNL